jgi:hypothetical protein
VFDVPAEHVRPCPLCGGSLALDAILCHRCGLNLQTGRRMDEPEVAAREEEQEEPSALARTIVFVGEWIPGLFMPGVLALSVLCLAVGLALVWMCVFFFSLGAVISAFPMGAVALLCCAQGVAMFLGGQVAPLTELLLEFSGGKWLLFFLLLLGPFIGMMLIAQEALLGAR